MRRRPAKRPLSRLSRTGGIRAVCFEGGEPFLYYATLLEAVREVKSRGWRAEIVTNAYWASSLEDAVLARVERPGGLRAALPRERHDRRPGALELAEQATEPVGSRHGAWIVVVGWNAAQANQNASTCWIGRRRRPASGPRTA